MKIQISLFIILFCQNLLAQSNLDRVYLKVKDTSVTTHHLLFGENSLLQKMNFGLTEKQKEEIFEISQGQVDFRNIYIHHSPYIVNELKEYITSYGSSTYLPPEIVTEPDPKAVEGWWLKKLQAPEAWMYATGAGVTIADCDAGYFINEPDLLPNLLLEYKKDFSDTDDPLTVDDGNFTHHGTAVVAIMSAVLDQNGTNGIAYNSKVVPLQNYNYASNDKLDKEEATAQCILEAIGIPDVDIIVLENQTSGSSETFEGTREAVKLALMSGITIVSAGGNSSNELLIEEQNDTGSIIVGAIQQDGKPEWFSNYGSRVSIAAYGSDLLTLHGPDGSFGSFGGTSGATPQVAATVALMLEINPELTPEEIKEILIETRETTEENKTVGGALNTLQAVEATKKRLEETPPHIASKKTKMKEFRKKLQTVFEI